MTELTGQVQNQGFIDEHDNKAPQSKKVSIFGYDTANDILRRVSVTAQGSDYGLNIAGTVSLGTAVSIGTVSIGNYPSTQAVIATVANPFVNILGTVSQGAALPAGTNNIGDVDVLTINGQAPAFGSGARSASTQRVTIATDDVVPVTDNSGTLTVDAPVGTPVFVRLSDGSSAIATLPVSIASTVTTKETRSGTGTTTSVADTDSSTTLLASNSDRLGASIYNDSTVILYIKAGTTASATSFAVKLQPEEYWEAPANYTGRIDGIWASNASGSARITEYT